MSLRRILIYGDPKLHEVAEPVHEIDGEIQELISDLFETMISAKGVGLAATQLGVRKSVFVVEIRDSDDESDSGTLSAFINPEIIETGGMCSFEEGCLSIPGVTAEVERPEEISVKYLNEKGEQRILHCEGLLARAIQHECDHLQGVLFVDRLRLSEKKKLTHQLRALARGVEV